HAHSRHGQGQGQSRARRRRHHGPGTRLAQPGAAGSEHEGSEHQAEARPRPAVGKVGRAIDCPGAQAAAQNQLLNPILTPMQGPRKATRMVKTGSKQAAPAAPQLHPVLQALLSRPTPAVMGVLNVTPDSFSDGGKFLAPNQALAQAKRLIADGADLIDIGAESTRPYGGGQPVSADMELRRLQPVLAEIVALGVPVSIDSMKADVVAWALDQGAAIANDVWGLQRGDGMAALLAARNAPVIVMHNRDRADPSIDIMQDIAAFFERSLDVAARTGLARENIVLDPGIGFGKTQEQSLIALARLDELKSFGLPLLVGASRKVFIASVSPSEPQQRLGGSVAAHLAAARRGAGIIRTHDVAETVQALRVLAAIEDKR